ncbi:MAG: hypothetical protein Q4G04_05215 [bacterium]|nr:hypothetical protein [bacterium]
MNNKKNELKVKKILQALKGALKDTSKIRDYNQDFDVPFNFVKGLMAVNDPYGRKL